MIDSHGTVAVCDAGPLIHLDEIECLDVMEDFAKVIVPACVWNEAQMHRPKIFDRRSPVFEKVAPQYAYDEEIVAIAALLMLHRGEIDALRCARQVSGSILITDDSAARLAAKTLGIAAHGTIGVLIRAIRKKRKSSREIVSLLESLPRKSSLFIRKSLLDEII